MRSHWIVFQILLMSAVICILKILHGNEIKQYLKNYFSVRGYLPLIRKVSSTHMHVLAVYVKEGLPFARGLSLENSADSYLCFRLALLHSVSYFFFLY